MAKLIKLTDPIREFTAAVGVHSREGGAYSEFVLIVCSRVLRWFLFSMNSYILCEGELDYFGLFVLPTGTTSEKSVPWEKGRPRKCVKKKQIKLMASSGELLSQNLYQEITRQEIYRV